MPTSVRTTLDCLRLLAVVAFDLVRPAKPENRLPRRWLARAAWPA